MSRLVASTNPGSLTSLHETSLNSDVEDVRSSCSAYLPVRPRYSLNGTSDLDEVRIKMNVN